MLVVAKAPRINVEVFGEGMDELVKLLRREIPDVVITPEPSGDDDEFVNVVETDWYKKMQAEWHPGDTISVKREHLGLTQAELAERTGMSIPSISLIENRKRGVGVRTARKLAAALGIPVERLIRP